MIDWVNTGYNEQYFHHLKSCKYLAHMVWVLTSICRNCTIHSLDWFKQTVKYLLFAMHKIAAETSLVRWNNKGLEKMCWCSTFLRKRIEILILFCILVVCVIIVFNASVVCTTAKLFCVSIDFGCFLFHYENNFLNIWYHMCKANQVT